MEKKRIWIYCRTAYPDRAALDAQEEFLTTCAEENGLEVVGVTAEHGSGLDFSRHGLKEIITMAEAGKADVLLIMNLSQIGREPARVACYLRRLKEYDIEVVCPVRR